jgi:hypothetical protein
MIFGLIFMINNDFLKFYSGAIKLKRQHDSLRQTEKDYVNDGVKKSYVKQSTDGIHSAIEQCEDRLNKELEELVKKKDYNGAKMIISCLAGDERFLESAKPREGNREMRSKTNNTEINYKTPLPEDLYNNSENLASLIKNSRKYRNDEGECEKLTWNRIAERAEISGSYIQMICKKGKVPSEKVISKLAEVFGGNAQKFLEVAKKNS